MFSKYYATHFHWYINVFLKVICIIHSQFQTYSQPALNLLQFAFLHTKNVSINDLVSSSHIQDVCLSFVQVPPIGWAGQWTLQTTSSRCDYPPPPPQQLLLTLEHHTPRLVLYSNMYPEGFVLYLIHHLLSFPPNSPIVHLLVPTRAPTEHVMYIVYTYHHVVCTHIHTLLSCCPTLLCPNFWCVHSTLAVHTILACITLHAVVFLVCTPVCVPFQCAYVSIACLHKLDHSSVPFIFP